MAPYNKSVSSVAATLRQPLRVGIVGAGFIADYHCEILRSIDELTLAGVCDPVETRARNLQSKWQIESACSSIDELLATARPDVVHVVTPPATHFDVACRLLEAGVHVLLEKPMTLGEPEAVRLAELAADKGVALGVNHNWVSQPLFDRALQDIRDRKIGPVRHVVSINSLPLFQLLGGQHDHWMFQTPTNVLFEQAPHPISQIVELVGCVEQAATRKGGKTELRGGGTFFADWQFSLQAEHATAQMYLSFGRVFPDARLHILGVDGSIHIDQLNNLYHLDRRTNFIDPCDRCVRSLRRGMAAMLGGCKEVSGYVTGLLRLTGRQDVYYLGMQKSVEDFYQELAERQSAPKNLDVSMKVMNALHRIVEDCKSDVSDDGSSANPSTAIAGDVAKADASLGKTLVIGGTGFIGRHVIERFARAGVPVRVLARSPKRIVDLTSQYDIEVFRGDVLNKSDVHQAARGCRSIIHLVAGAPDDWAGFEELFIGGLKNTIDVATELGIERLVYASSIASLYLGSRSETVTDLTPVDAKVQKRCHYAQAKIICEQLLNEHHQKNGLPFVTMRPGIVIGKGTPPQHLGVGEWPSEISCVRWGRDVNGPLPFVLAEDVAEAFLQAHLAPLQKVNGKAFNLVGDVRLSSEEYIQTLRTESQRDFQLHKQSISYWTGLEWLKWTIKALARKPENVRLTWRELNYRSGAAAFDTSIVKQTLGWKPESCREAFIEKGIRVSLD